MTGTADPPPIDIRLEHLEIVRDILRRHVPEYEVWAFGSRVTGNAKPYSDLDLAIITARPLSPDLWSALTEDFSESDLPWKVDVVDWAAAGEAFRRMIERAKAVIQKALRA